MTGELEWELTEQFWLEIAFHYKYNGWTTGLTGDERNGEHEQIVQVDIAARYRFTDSLEFTVGFQGAHRKESFESGLKNLNT